MYGDTTGTISLYLLAGSSYSEGCTSRENGGALGGEERHTSGGEAVYPDHHVLSTCVFLCGYPAHVMGANALSVILLEQTDKDTQPPSPSPPPITTSLPPLPPSPLPTPSLSWRLFIASGGDDQAIGGCTVVLDLMQTQRQGLEQQPPQQPQSQPQPQHLANDHNNINGDDGDDISSKKIVQLKTSLTHHRAGCCASSAIKGIKVQQQPQPQPLESPQSQSQQSQQPQSQSPQQLLPPQPSQMTPPDMSSSILTIISVGYDQRLSVWRVRSPMLMIHHELSSSFTLAACDSTASATATATTAPSTPSEYVTTTTTSTTTMIPIMNVVTWPVSMATTTTTPSNQLSDTQLGTKSHTQSRSVLPHSAKMLTEDEECVDDRGVPNDTENHKKAKEEEVEDVDEEGDDDDDDDDSMNLEVTTPLVMENIQTITQHRDHLLQWLGHSSFHLFIIPSFRPLRPYFPSFFPSL